MNNRFQEFGKKLTLMANRLLSDETLEGLDLQELLSGSSLEEMPLAAE